MPHTMAMNIHVGQQYKVVGNVCNISPGEIITVHKMITGSYLDTFVVFLVRDEDSGVDRKLHKDLFKKLVYDGDLELVPVDHINVNRGERYECTVDTLPGDRPIEACGPLDEVLKKAKGKNVNLATTNGLFRGFVVDVSLYKDAYMVVELLLFGNEIGRWYKDERAYIYSKSVEQCIIWSGGLAKGMLEELYEYGLVDISGEQK